MSLGTTNQQQKLQRNVFGLTKIKRPLIRAPMVYLMVYNTQNNRAKKTIKEKCPPNDSLAMRHGSPVTIYHRQRKRKYMQVFCVCPKFSVHPK